MTFKPYNVFPQQSGIHRKISYNLTVETFLCLEQIVIFPCDCLDFHEIGYRETMIELVDDILPFQYYVKGTLLIVYAVLWMKRSMHPQFLVINHAVFQVEECVII
jgi:hypothetical protein